MNMMLLPLHKAGSNCCTRKNGARTFTAKRFEFVSAMRARWSYVAPLPTLLPLMVCQRT
jgi:hypothetical protein